MPPRTNQHKPLRQYEVPQCFCVSKDMLAPLDVIGPHILECWKMKMTDVQILTELQTKVIDSKIHGIGYYTTAVTGDDKLKYINCGQHDILPENSRGNGPSQNSAAGPQC
jgi:hypothetical protein